MTRTVDLSVDVGGLRLANPVMTAAGTYGLGTEFSAYGDPSTLGALVVKSLSAFPWAGNRPPRVRAVAGGSMINAVGLDNPGVAVWASDHLSALRSKGARVVASIWGRTVEEYRGAAEALAVCDGVVAWEINLSCPNLEDPRRMFAHDAKEAAEVVAAVRDAAGAARTVWAKLSPNATDIVEVGASVSAHGADAVTLVNTLSGMAIDVESRRPILDNGYGGVSGPALHPVALRAVHQVHRELPHDTGLSQLVGVRPSSPLGAPECGAGTDGVT